MLKSKYIRTLLKPYSNETITICEIYYKYETKTNYSLVVVVVVVEEAVLLLFTIEVKAK